MLVFGCTNGCSPADMARSPLGARDAGVSLPNSFARKLLLRCLGVLRFDLVLQYASAA